MSVCFFCVFPIFANTRSMGSIFDKYAGCGLHMKATLIKTDINQSVSRLMRNYDGPANGLSNSKAKSNFPLFDGLSLDHLKQQLKICKGSLIQLSSIDEPSPEEQFQTMICRSICKHASMQIDLMERQQQQYEESMKAFTQQDLFRRNKKQESRMQMEQGDLFSDIGIDVQITKKQQQGDKP